MNKKWETKEVNDLLKVIVALETKEQAKCFFRDLLTEQELVEFGRRWKVAKLLDQGVSYVEIEKQTGMSSTTIARIAKWLKSGMGGYQSMLHHHSLM